MTIAVEEPKVVPLEEVYDLETLTQMFVDAAMAECGAQWEEADIANRATALFGRSGTGQLAQGRGCSRRRVQVLALVARMFPRADPEEVFSGQRYPDRNVELYRACAEVAGSQLRAWMREQEGRPTEEVIEATRRDFADTWLARALEENLLASGVRRVYRNTIVGAGGDVFFRRVEAMMYIEHSPEDEATRYTIEIMELGASKFAQDCTEIPVIVSVKERLVESPTEGED